MRKPKISKGSSDPELSGSDGPSSWVRGRNCIYQDASTGMFRVSIKAQVGWKTYGYFHDLGVASYVANIAIFNENCEAEYERNESGNKDRQELNLWLSRDNNREREEVARNKNRMYKINRDQAKKQEDLRKEQRAQELQIAQTERERQEAEFIAGVSKSMLLEFLQSDIGGEQYRKIRAEINRRNEMTNTT